MKKVCLFLICLLINSVPFARTTDLWLELSRSFKLKDQSTVPQVKAQIHWLLTHPTYFQALAKNSEPYIYYILEQIKAQNLPGELALLPMIESNYNPFAYSHAGAAGLWQLMPGTGSGLGVKQNWWYDGRRGITSSTKAALDYLTYLGQFFKGNWIHAIAAYDSGEGTVQRAIRRNSAKGISTSFWDLSLPRETQAYLPRLLAMASIIKYPRYFGANLPKQSYQVYFDEVPLAHQIDLSHAAKLANISYETLLQLNPGHNRWTTAPQKHNTGLLLPLTAIDTFIKNLKKLPKSKFTQWDRYQVKAGDSLGIIAQKHHSSTLLIKHLNQLKSDTIRIGQTLLVPHNRSLTPKTLTETRKKLAINHAKKIGPHRQVHVVQPNDSLAKIAQQYHIKTAEIKFWNQLKSNTLSPEQKLVIWQNKPTKIHKQHYHIVKLGESLTVIAHKYHLKLKQLLKLNPTLADNHLIKPKQKIKVS